MPPSGPATPMMRPGLAGVNLLPFLRGKYKKVTAQIRPLVRLLAKSGQERTHPCAYSRLSVPRSGEDRKTDQLCSQSPYEAKQHPCTDLGPGRGSWPWSPSGAMAGLAGRRRLCDQGLGVGPVGLLSAAG